MNNEVMQWLDFANTDLNVAKHLDNSFFPKPLEIICYHCQQAAEKAIKALIISRGAAGGMPQKHDLSFLLGQLRNTLDIPDRYYDIADSLTPYGVRVRYPGEMEVTEKNAADAIRASESLLLWIKSNME